MNPATIIRRGLRAALRRRYGYAALRTWRIAQRRALTLHRSRQHGAAPYSTKTDDLTWLCWRALKKIGKRFPRLNLDDPRANP